VDLVILAEWVNRVTGWLTIIELARTHQKASWAFAPGLLVIGGIGLLTDFFVIAAWRRAAIFRW